MNLITLFEKVFNQFNNYLYHTCSISSLKHNLKYNSISSRYEYKDSGDTTSCICVSRSDKFNIRTTKEDIISAQFVLDKQLLNNKYKIVPFTDNNKRIKRDNKGMFIQTASEERILTDNIPSVSQYIKCINIYILEGHLEDEKVVKNVKWINNQKKKYSFPFKFFTFRLSDLSKGSENMYEMFNIKEID